MKRSLLFSVACSFLLATFASETAWGQEEELPTDASVLGQKLRAFDKNGDGQLSPDEMTGRGVRRMITQAARRAGLPSDGSIPIQGLVDATNAKRGKTSEAPAKTETKTPGSASPPAFGDPAPKTETPKPSGGFAQPGSSSSTGGSNINNIEFAEGLLKQKDVNKNGVIDKDEMKELKERYHAADANKDGAITRDELIARVTELNNKSGSSSSMVAAPSAPTPAASSPSGSGSSASPPRPGPSSRPDNRPSWKGPQGMSAPKSRKWWENVPTDGKDKRKTFKTKTPTERLPKGLPEFFGRSDADGDGQVSMAEYSATWNETKAAEFAKYDLDQDGFITVDEAMNASSTPKK